MRHQGPERTDSATFSICQPTRWLFIRAPMNPEIRTIELPLLEGLKIKKAKVIGGDEVLVELEGKIKLTLPDVLPSDYANVIEITTK